MPFANKERKKQYEKQWCLKNRERLLKKQRVHYQRKSKEKKKIYTQKNKEKISEYQKEYRLKHKQKQVKQSKAYYQKNKKKLSLKMKIYYCKHKEQIIQHQKEYRERNRVKARQIRNKYFKTRRIRDKNFSVKLRLKALLNNTIRRYLKTGKTQSASKYGINYEKIIAHLKPFPKNIQGYHIDHIKPLSSFNFNDLEQIKQAFAPENHQWLTIKENRLKGNKLNWKQGAN